MTPMTIRIMLFARGGSINLECGRRNSWRARTYIEGLGAKLFCCFVVVVFVVVVLVSCNIIMGYVRTITRPG